MPKINPTIVSFFSLKMKLFGFATGISRAVALPPQQSVLHYIPQYITSNGLSTLTDHLESLDSVNDFIIKPQDFCQDHWEICIGKALIVFDLSEI